MSDFIDFYKRQNLSCALASKLACVLAFFRTFHYGQSLHWHSKRQSVLCDGHNGLLSALQVPLFNRKAVLRMSKREDYFKNLGISTMGSISDKREYLQHLKKGGA